MPTTTSPPILIWQPGGGTPTWTPAPPPAGHAPPENGLTVLTIGQNYVDVVFVTTQPRADWTFAGLEVVNVTDTAPLNIWVGVATSKTRNGFRVYLNGLPDTGNYYLDWSINGGTVADAGTATTYLLSGPDNGPNGAGTTFTVALPLGATVDSVVTVTPDDGGVPGTFSPATVELTSDMPSANFVYTPGSYGARTITVTNDSLLTDPGGIGFTSVVGTYLLSGPSGGASGVASTNFTASLPVGGVTLNTITVTPTDALPAAPVGVFTPGSVNLTTVAPSATFIYTPPAAGIKTISTTNNRGLTDPAPLTYTATAPFSPSDVAGLAVWLKADSLALSDGAAVASWLDQTTNHYDVTATGAEQPTFKTGIVNGKPILRFNGTTNRIYHSGVVFTTQPDTIFVVAKATGTADWYLIGDDSLHIFVGQTPTNNIAIYAGGSVVADAVSHAGAFHVFTGVFNGASSQVYVDGSLVASGNAGISQLAAMCLMSNSVGLPSVYSPGDIAEVVIYNVVLSSTDRGNVTNYLRTKYGI